MSICSLKPSPGKASWTNSLQLHLPARGWKPHTQRPADLALPLLYNYISPQGDGNNFALPEHSSPRTFFTTTSPRKGMETLHHPEEHAELRPLQLHLPARGWKPCRTSVKPVYRKALQLHLPARGWKRRIVKIFSRFATGLYNYISPQGDGNVRSNHNHGLGLTLQLHLPARGWKLDDEALSDVSIAFTTTSPRL